LAAEYTPDEQARIIKASFQNQGKNLVEVLQLSRSTPSQIHSMVSFEGEGCLKEAADRGRGVIFVTAHLGNWELMAVAVAMRFPLSVVAAPIYDPKIEEIMVGLRKTYSIETVVRGQPHSLRRLLTALKNRGVVGMLMDQDTRVDGAFVPFFGREAYTPIGPASLALRTGAAVVTGFIIRLPDHRHRIVVRGPVELTQTGDRKSDIQANTDRFTQAIEGFVRAFPDQWIWMHERWKRGGQISNLSPSRNQ
jgi:KDO2-lipid IV(A) lauroyltransferase